IIGAKTKKMITLIWWNIGGVSEFRSTARRQRSINLVASDRRHTSELTFRNKETGRPQFAVNLVVPIIYETDAIVHLRRWRDQLRVWQHNLGIILDIDIHPHHDPIVITIERCAEGGVAVVWIVEHHIEHDQPGAGPKQTIQ